MALAVRAERGLVARHASFGKEREVIEERIEEFVDRQATYRKWPVIGIALALPLDARAEQLRQH
jgi:hypothetical protein